MVDSTYYDFKKEQNDRFEKHIPDIFIQQIKNTKSANDVHFQQLKKLHYFYNTIYRVAPGNYLSKSRIRLDSSVDMFCKSPYAEGAINNMIILLEKQFFDCISLLYSGSYRPIMIILRYMLELVTITSLSIIDKKQLTGKSDDEKKGMSYIQFEGFLSDSFEARKKEKSARNSDEEYMVRIMKSEKMIPEPYPQYLEFKGCLGNDAIKKLRNELSIYAHANIFQQLQFDGDLNDTCIEETGLFVGKINKAGYHKSLATILTTHKFIFYLLLVTIYEDVGYHQLQLAKNFFADIFDELSYLKPHINFSNIECLIKNPPNINLSNIPNTVKFDEDEDEYEDVRCPHCESLLYYPNEECPMCHFNEFGRQNM